MFDETPEISPDLEWILLSGQADQAMFLEILVNDYAPRMYQLYKSVLLDPDLADQATRYVCVNSFKHKSLYNPEDGVETWLVRLSLPVLKKMWRRYKKNGTGQPVNENLQRLLEKLTWKPRLILTLKEVWGWENEQIANALKSRLASIELELESTWQEIENGAGSQYSRAEILEWLNTSQVPIDNDPKIQDQWLEECLRTGFQGPRLPSMPLILRETLVVGFAIVLILLGVWFYNRWFPGPEQNQVAFAQITLAPEIALERMAEPVRYTVLQGESLEEIAERLNLSVEHLQNLNQISPGIDLKPGQVIYVNLVQSKDKDGVDDHQAVRSSQDNQATPGETPAAALKPSQQPPGKLDQGSSPSEVKQYWETSQRLWNNIFIEAQWIDYGPPNYLGPSNKLRIQAWISQPGSSLVKTGNLSGAPHETSLINDGVFIQEKAGSEKTLAWWKAPTFPLNPASPIFALLSPSELIPQLADQNWQVKKGGRVANRPSILVETTNPDQSRYYQINIDVETGIVLRIQTLDTSSQLVLSDLVITKIQLDPDFNSTQLFDPLRIHESYFTDNYLYPFPETWQISQQVELAVQERPRLLENFQAAPEGYQAGAGYVRFQVPTEISASNQVYTNTQIILDGYFLDEIPLSAFWQTSCQRSPLGDILALHTLPGSTAQVKPGILWINLQHPREYYTVMPDFEIFHMAFHPNNKDLAVFARKTNSNESGLYLLNFATGEYQPLLPLESLNYLHWKPDGSYLSFLGKEPGQEKASWIIMHLESGLVTYKTPAQTYPDGNPTQLNPPPGYPAWDWGIDLVGHQVGLGACAIP